mmetsp:Transcript_13003/g.23134  ORF Transcript_13003/g.23134 Transcript_13003/m.23134 type:complete len:238 (+) Transcript_13003:463-1176(+)
MREEGGGEGWHLRAASDTDCGGGRILLVVRVQDHDDFQAARGDGVGDIRGARPRVHHVQKVLRHAHVIPRINHRLAFGGFVCNGGQCRHFRDDVDAATTATGGGGDVEVVVEEAGQRADDAHHDGHRVRVASEAGVKLDQRLVHHPTRARFGLKLRTLRPRRKLAVKQQQTAVDHIALRRELLDGIPAVEEQSFVAVDKGDRGVAGSGGGEARVEAAKPRLAVQSPYVKETPTRGVQ